MKSTLFLTLIGCLLLFSACEDETISNMADINDQWTKKNIEAKELEHVYQEIMDKYNASSYSAVNLSAADPSKAEITLFDVQKNVLGKISDEDKAIMVSAITGILNINKEMSQLQDVDEVFSVVEEQPMPKKGMEGYFQYIAQNLKYPEQARKMGIEGKVYVEFIVNDFGEITNVKVLKGIGAGCDEAAKKVVENSTPWQPGRQKGQAVKVKMVLPITFKLNDGEG